MTAVTADLSEMARLQASHNGDVHHYALVDAAQNPELPSVLGGAAACLFGSSPGTPIAHVSPHLVALPDDLNARAWQSVVRYASASPCLTVIASSLSLNALHRHLNGHLQVKIGKDAMHLAYWDPAILAVLVGQEDDDTLYVQGPVFDPGQRASFLSALVAWWYWDRRQVLRRIRPVEGEYATTQAADLVLPLEFKPSQTDLLVQASLPDRILYELRVNQPHLLGGRDEWHNYDLTRRLLNSARGLRIHGLRDQVNFVGTGMILGEEFHLHPDVQPYLEDVPSGSKRFVEALQRVPAEALEAARSQAVSRGEGPS